MAKNLVRSVTIDAPAEKVFSFLSDPSHWMLAFPGESEVTEVNIKPDGVGTSARWSAKMFGINMSVTHEHLEVIPKQRIVSKASVGPVLTFSLEPVAAGTELSVEQSFDIHPPFVRVPVQALFARWSESDIDALVANIKSLVESAVKAVTEAEMAKLPHTLTWSGEISIDAPVQRVFDLVKDPTVWLGPEVQITNYKPSPRAWGQRSRPRGRSLASRSRRRTSTRSSFRASTSRRRRRWVLSSTWQWHRKTGGPC